LQGSANEMYGVLDASDFFDQRYAYSVFYCDDVDEEWLVDIQLVEDRWRCKGGFEVLENLLTFVIPRELRGFFE